MTRVVGIDPGANGCIALIDTDTNETKVYDFPKLEKEIDVMELFGGIVKSLGVVDLCVIESVHALPRQSTVAGFKFGVAVGIARAISGVLCCRTEYVSPQRWKKYFNINNAEKAQLKEMAVLKARSLFPKLTDVLLKSKDGRSEALLIAEYGVRNLIIK